MSFIDQGLQEKARDFIDAYLSQGGPGKGRPVLIAYHGDGDGCCAAYFLRQYLKHPALFYWVATPDFDFARAEAHILQQRPGLTIFLDMPVQNRIRMIEDLCASGKVFVYDHHQIGKSSLPEPHPSLLYINPVVHQDGKAFPTALFGWELLKDSGAFEKEVLFMALFTETWLDRIPLFAEFDQAHRDLLKETGKRIHTSFLVQGMGNTHYGLDFLIASSGRELTPENLQSSRTYAILENVYRLVENERSWIMRVLAGEIRKLTAPAFIFKKIESRLRLCGLIASELRWKHPDLPIGIWQRWNERYLCELRHGDACEVDFARLIEQAKAKVQILSGGGHPMAAAFTADGESFFKALRLIRDLLTVI